MKIQRTKNSIRNIFWGFVNKGITLFVPFITRTLIIRLLGPDYLGLSSLFTSILSVLSLAELGFGSAIVFSMYKPIAEDDSYTICALMLLYKKVYHIMGSIVLCVGLILLPFLKNLINGDVPTYINIYLLYLVYLLNSVVSYFLFAYKNCLLTAHQREDINSNIGSIVTILQYGLQILILVVWHNYYLYIAVLPISTMVSNIWRAKVAEKLYPQYKCMGKLDPDYIHELKKKILALSCHSIAGVCCYSFDTVIISAYVNLTAVTVYTNYMTIYSAVTGIITIIFSSIKAGVGNCIATESLEKNFHIFKRLYSINTWIAVVCSVCFLCLYQTFMYLWMGEKYLLPYVTVILIVMQFYIRCIRMLMNVYKDANGLWWEDKWRPFIESALNLSLNIFLSRYIGINGVVLSTVISTGVLCIPWETWIVFNKYFHMDVNIYYKLLGKGICLTIATYFLTYKICAFYDKYSITSFLFKIIVCMIIPNIVLACFYHNDIKEILEDKRRVLCSRSSLW